MLLIDDGIHVFVILTIPFDEQPRKWQKSYVKVGGFVIQKWIPDTDVVTARLQQFKGIKVDRKKPLRRNVARNKTIGRASGASFADTDE